MVLYRSWLVRWLVCAFQLSQPAIYEHEGTNRFVPNPTTGVMEPFTYTIAEPYPFMTFIVTVWFFILLAHLIHVWSAYRHERAIQREMERESALELERLRLEVELARSKRGYEPEKSKRGVQLTDDGELYTEEDYGVISASEKRRGLKHNV